MTAKGPVLRLASATLLAASVPMAAQHAAAHGGGYGGYGGYGDSAQVEITGSIPATCAFTTTPSLSNIGAIQTGLVKDLGSLGFTCNLATTSSVNLTVKSTNGGLKRYGGPETVAYQIAWDIQGAVDVYFTIPTSPVGFTLLSGATGVEQLGAYKVKVTGPTAGNPAGVYKDVVTYTISP